MKRADLVVLVKEVMQELDEANVTNAGGASFTPGAGAQYATPKAFGKEHRAKKTLTKIGYKQVSRPKRPSHTKGFDYL
jgi:chromosome segregation and condensation protein ScpB